MNTQKVESNITLFAIIVGVLMVAAFFSACTPVYKWSVKKECLVDQHQRCTDVEEIAKTSSRDTVQARFLIERAQIIKRIELGE